MAEKVDKFLRMNPNKLEKQGRNWEMAGKVVIGLGAVAFVVATIIAAMTKWTWLDTCVPVLITVILVGTWCFLMSGAKIKLSNDVAMTNSLMNPIVKIVKDGTVKNYHSRRDIEIHTEDVGELLKDWEIPDHSDYSLVKINNGYLIVPNTMFEVIQ